MSTLPTRASAAEPSSEPVVDVVVVNWNSGVYLRQCIAALDQSSLAEKLHVTVVDNASVDGSASALACTRARLRVIANKDNRGFGCACNQGARDGQARYVLFLNADVRVERDTIERTIAFTDDPRQDDVGIAGVQLFNDQGELQRSCARAPGLVALTLHPLFLDRLCPSIVPPHFLREWDHSETRTVDQVMGAFLLVRRALFEQLGGFDRRFFLYYEDVDLCLAARRAGWRVAYFAGARAMHAGGGSSNAVKGQRLYHLAVSKAEYAAKWHGRPIAVLAILMTLSFELPIRWLHAVVTRSPQEGEAASRAMAWFVKDLRGLARRIVVGA